MTTKEAARPLSPRGFWGHAPQKNLKFRSSEMRFPAFWALKTVLFLYNLKISEVVVVSVKFAFFSINIIFIFINEIQTDGSM